MKKYILILAISILAVSVNVAESSGRIIDLVEAARSQIGQTLKYDPGYRGMDYPNGDVSMDRGVCTDVIIRAMRVAYDGSGLKALIYASCSCTSQYHETVH